MTGKILYRPVRVIARPDPIEVASSPTINGNVSRPEVGDSPLTICRYWGRKMIAPNIATPTMNPARLVITKVWFANRRGGMIGSALLPHSQHEKRMATAVNV